MPKIRIVRGSYRTLDGERAESGDVIELEEGSIERLPEEKFEYVDADSDEEESESAETDEQDAFDDDAPDPVGDTVSTDEEAEEKSDDDLASASPEDLIPYDDYNALSGMAAEYEGPEVHGAMSTEDITAFFETLTTSDLYELQRQAGVNVSGDE